ncbi:phosphoribosylamine--glycine ligase [Dyadobacter sp. BE34]|uniref:Phosphoribosylamine--glycine ligase n=1 Tax=Dyadobacter fermentans TaxID=94254 RepID=A0ABU1R310_9BACT|nr:MULTISPECIES: phosphoribosylamine--glycine ligase [Dyadobacter]MDR6807783.1 phosphoribosylamine--glycine ligase [Dyadobacter fermentans]MDR7045524.1 phosphoribosylamine--glycine ligase [Dyadobacter sp. BE242]MDR7199837.1 phosphoribosylamine--glycine ligase [Dyadobacter sp. BE34]MDR7217704.1 phosphoribosylamine--glycine ligase [Dyadobacter sp. BE31]MDR7265728.1 phosphoribosylamine--glycine ligase [Dyadobacter sp. BE32]
MNILILGSGGREHAFAWKIAQSPLCDTLFMAPGNAGTAGIATNLSISYNDFDSIANAVIENNIELVIVGPEEPLVNGVVDYFNAREDLSKVRIIGPDKAGAQLEGSKDFSKQFMDKYGIPTAASRTFTAEDLEVGLEYLENHSLPIVLKADGLAAGKGVIIAEKHSDAVQAFREMLLDGKFGKAGNKVVIEQFLKGIELSVFVLTDGEHYKILPEAKDYKRIGENDTGLNTGGMGAVSPVVFADANFIRKVEEKVVKPTLHGLQSEGIKYVGFIFIGLMNIKGEPYVIEYNVRMGDPETEVVVPRIQSDFAMLMASTAKGTLQDFDLQISPQVAVTTVVVSGGYPEDYEKGKVISGTDKVEDVHVFHAGTTFNANAEVVTNGGRVMALTGLANSLENAVHKSQRAAQAVQYEGKYFRHDIGVDLIRYND